MLVALLLKEDTIGGRAASDTRGSAASSDTGGGATSGAARFQELEAEVKELENDRNKDGHGERALILGGSTGRK